MSTPSRGTPFVSASPTTRESARETERFPISVRTRGFVLDRRGVRSVLRVTLALEGADDGSVGLLLCGDRSMRALNRDFRGKDRTTDVLSFPAGADDPTSRVLPGEPRFLGDLAISLPTCRRQAEERAVDPGSEFLRLLVHGTLHLLGYDHIEEIDRRRMVPRERRARLRCEREGLGPGLLRPEGR